MGRCKWCSDTPLFSGKGVLVREMQIVCFQSLDCSGPTRANKCDRSSRGSNFSSSATTDLPV
jgi:hypothetical protein